LAVEDCALLDQWAIRKAEQLQLEIIEDFNSYQFHNIYQKMSSFCSQDMGAFYLDVLKDRLYTAKEGSKARTSAQTAMHHILQAMIRWMAPIMTFTADEIWRLIGNNENILFEQWYKFPEMKENSSWNQENWDVLQEIRNANTKLLEELRIKGDIGSSLDASVEIYLEQEQYDKLIAINEELRFVLITSAAQIKSYADKPEDAIECSLEDFKLAIVANVASGDKCVRCWHKSEEVGNITDHPELCGRCVTNIDGDGEVRVFA
jgi:isoleucyl-tRNA synthetase